MLPYFLETSDNIIWFAFNKINNQYLCFPKYLKSYKGKKYTEWYVNNVNPELEKYYKQFNGLNQRVFLVDAKLVKKIYYPLEFSKNIENYHLKYNFDFYVKNIINMISDFFKIEKKYIGIEGSLLLNKYNKNSDIDILVYGKDNAKRIQKKFLAFQDYNNLIRLFNEKESDDYVKERFDCGYGNNLEKAKKQFFRRYYGFIGNKQFSIVCVPNEECDGYINLNREIVYLNQFNGCLKIINDENSCVTPSVYIGIDENDNKYKIEVYNHYGINQIKKGEKVYIKGNLYLNKNENEKIITIAFWNRENERLDLCE